MSLHDELSAPPPTIRCITCKFLSTLSSKEQAEWNDELKLRTITNESIVRALRLRGTIVTSNAVRAHRTNHLPLP